MKRFSPYLIIFSIVITACNILPSNVNSVISILVSTDTLSFDTVISGTTTTTKEFRIINNSSETVILKSVSLASGDNTYFRLNIDGEACPKLDDIEVLANDSIYVFVAATFSDFDTDSVCFMTDSVMVVTEESTVAVHLITWSQDVIRKSGVFLADETWDASRPYLIQDSVEMAYGTTLSIKEGVHVFFHNNAFLRIQGGIKVDGSFNNPVVFCGDRFDETLTGIDYETASGQWNCIQIYPWASECSFNYIVIKNSMSGVIVAGSPNYDEIPSISISNSIIKNNSYTGIASYGANITCYNTVFLDNNIGLAMFLTGSCNLNHVTFNNNYIDETRDVGSVYIQNYYTIDSITYISDFDELKFTNSVIYGNVDDEITIIPWNETSIGVELDYCLLKLENDDMLDYITSNGLIRNEDPLLVNFESYGNIYPDTLSPVLIMVMLLRHNIMA